MDNILFTLFSWQFLLFCLGLASILFVVRTTVEYFLKCARKAPLWNELLLPILPVLTGGFTGLFITTYPYPPGIDAPSGRVLFGLVAGLLSGLVYRVLKSILKARVTFGDPNNDHDIDDMVAKTIVTEHQPEPMQQDQAPIAHLNDKDQ